MLVIGLDMSTARMHGDFSINFEAFLLFNYSLSSSLCIIIIAIIAIIMGPRSYRDLVYDSGAPVGGLSTTFLPCKKMFCTCEIHCG